MESPPMRTSGIENAGSHNMVHALFKCSIASYSLFYYGLNFLFINIANWGTEDLFNFFDGLKRECKELTLLYTCGKFGTAEMRVFFKGKNWTQGP
ncbi:hypothetical protein LguiA_010843 [Lonicera macranthoides]